MKKTCFSDKHSLQELVNVVNDKGVGNDCRTPNRYQIAGFRASPRRRPNKIKEFTCVLNAISGPFLLRIVGIVVLGKLSNDGIEGWATGVRGFRLSNFAYTAYRTISIRSKNLVWSCTWVKLKKLAVKEKSFFVYVFGGG